MAVNYPASLDNFTNPTSSSSVANPSHSQQHSDANDAIEALQAKVGANGSAVTTSHDYKIAQLESLVTSSVAGAKSIYQDVRNQSGSSLAKATPVYVSGSEGASGKMLISAASNGAESTSSKTMGITTSAIANNSNGQVISEGILEGIDTTGAADGDPVWLGTNGAKIYGLANKPSAPAHLVFLGVVIRGGQANTGSMYVKIQNGFELQEIHNVAISSPINGNILSYDSTSQTWKNTNTLQSTSSTVPLVVKRVSGQTSNLQEWQDQTGGILAFFNKDGALTFNSSSALGAAININTSWSGAVGLIVKGVASQTNDLQQWQDSSGTVYSRIGSNGTFFWGGGSYLSSTLGTALIASNYSSNIPLTVRGAASQTADLQQWQNSAGTVLAKINASGEQVWYNPSNGTTLAYVSMYGELFAQGNIYARSASNYGASLNIATPTTTYIGAVIRGISGQTANLQEWQDSTGTILSAIKSGGEFIFRADNVAHTSSDGQIRLRFANNGNSTYQGYQHVFNNISSQNVATIGPNGNISIYLQNSNSVGLIVKGASSQSSNLQEWQNNSGTVLGSIASNGTLTINSQGNSNPVLSISQGGSTRFEINQWGQSWNNTKSTIGTYYNTDGGNLPQLSVFPISAGDKGIIVRGYPSQTANLQEWQDSSGNILAYITSSGSFNSAGQVAVVNGPVFNNTNNDGYMRPWTSTGSMVIGPHPSGSVSNVILKVKGIASQTGDLQQWQDSSANILAKIDASGIETVQGLVVSSQPAQINNTVYGFSSSNASPSAATYWKIATLPISGNGTYDHIQIDAILDDNWFGSGKTRVNILMGNRGGFTYKYYMYGDTRTGSKIIAYTESDGSVSVYAFASSGGYTSFS